jgi:Flp pilus assembly protein TadD
VSVAEDPVRLQAHAEALIDLGRPAEALPVLARASALDPDAMRPHALRASSLIALERYDEAQEAATAAITRAPEDSDAHRLLSLAQLRSGEQKLAKQTALQAVALDPEQSLNYVMLAEALQSTRDEAGALAAARHAIELEPDGWYGHDLEGRLLLDHDEPKRAEQAFRRALALDAENDGVLNNLSLALAIQGRRVEAVAGMEAATRIDPADELVRTNTLLVARRNFAWVRGIGMAMAIFGVVGGVLTGVMGDPAAGMAIVVVQALIGAGIYELGIRLAARRVPAPTAQLLLDDHRARRLKPWRWDWTWILRLRPWWWLALEKVPPPYALLINIGAGLLAPLLLLGVPFSAWRAWRWYRREHPGSGSWRPPA